jgi:hypothetical protein
MSARAVRIADLFPAGLGTVGESVEQEVRRSGGEAGAAGIAWPTLKDEAAARLKEALDVDVLELIGQAWSKARELREYADPVKHPPEETSIVHLGDHAVTCEVHPVLEVRLGDVALPELRFTVNVVAKFKSVALTIRGGAIRAVAPGVCSALAELKYRSVTLKREETPELRLPGRFDFRSGLRIA